MKASKNQRYTNGTVIIKVVKVEGGDVAFIHNGFVNHMSLDYFKKAFRPAERIIK